MVAIKQETTVQPGGIIQVRSDQFAPGARAEVIVIIQNSTPSTFPTMKSLIGAAPGGFKSPAEIDAYLRAERRRMATIAVASLVGHKLYLDANIFIYAVERHSDYVQLIDGLFGLLDAAQSTAITSELTLAECLSKPYADNDLPRQQLYEAAIAPRPGLEVLSVSRDILLHAARLRTPSKLRLPDAIHVATALQAACQSFITNDQLVRPFPGIQVIQLAELTL